MALGEPAVGGGGADVVDAEEEGEDAVQGVRGGVGEAAEGGGGDDFFDFGGDAAADVGEEEGVGFGEDFGGLAAEGGDGFAVGRGAPVVVDAGVVVAEFLEDLDGRRVGVGVLGGRSGGEGPAAVTCEAVFKGDFFAFAGVGGLGVLFILGSFILGAGTGVRVGDVGDTLVVFG